MRANKDLYVFFGIIKTTQSMIPFNIFIWLFLEILIQKELLMCHNVHYLFLVWIEYWVQPPQIDAIYINKLFFHV